MELPPLRQTLGTSPRLNLRRSALQVVRRTVLAGGIPRPDRWAPRWGTGRHPLRPPV